MRESIVQTAINRFLTWLAKKSVTALYKRTYFWVFSWGLDENTDLYLMSEVSYLGYHRFGVREEKIADIPQTEVITCPLQEENAEYFKWLYEDSPQTEEGNE